MFLHLDNEINIFKKIFEKCKINWSLFITIFLVPFFLVLLFYFIDYKNNLIASNNLINNFPICFCLTNILLIMIWFAYRMLKVKKVANKLIYRRYEFFLTSFIVSFLLWIFINLYIFVLALIFINKNIFLIKNLLFGQLIFSLFFLYIVCYSMVIFFVNCFDSIYLFWTTICLITFYSMIFSGQIIPYIILKNNLRIMQYFTLISPINYAISLINNTLMYPDKIELAKTLYPIFNANDYIDLLNGKNTSVFYQQLHNIYGTNIFDWKHDFKIGETKLYILYNVWNKILNIFIPILVYIIFNSLSWLIYVKIDKKNAHI